MREQFADPGYALHNPEQASAPMVVRFSTMSQDCASYGNSMFRETWQCILASRHEGS
jgi:hypothetical protein